MTPKTTPISLKPDQTINLTTQATAYTGRLTTSNSDRIYKFRLNRSSNLTVHLDGLGQNSVLELIQDRNRNGQLNTGEVIARTRSRAGNLGKLVRSGLQAGVFFLRVSLGGRTAANYSLKPTLQTPPPSPTPPTPPTATSFESQVLQLTNTFRQQNGLTPLSYNAKLAAAAESHSQNMALQDFFSHTGSNGSSPFDRMQAAGYNFSSAAENIGAGYATPEAVVQGWINSPGHRANMLNPNLRELGVGHYYLANDTGTVNWSHYWTQKFGTPA
ncbi:MAG: CAP domain-containing protein [Leptolyngbyaceae cyanobacterium SL_7_1]|nr:CAP domain-containing protein [Leptolyngbyaceae cyanobacterium SL_7_1]